MYGEKGYPIYDTEGKGHIDEEMFHTMESIGDIELKPWYSQKILSILLWLGYEPCKRLEARL